MNIVPFEQLYASYPSLDIWCSFDGTSGDESVFGSRFPLQYREMCFETYYILWDKGRTNSSKIRLYTPRKSVENARSSA